MAWLSKSGQVLLHPDFTSPTERWREAELELAPGFTMAGAGWWPLLVSGSAIFAHEVPASAVREVRESRANRRDGELSRLPCKLRDPWVTRQPPSLDETAVRLLLDKGDFSSEERLAGEYADNATLRNVIQRVIEYKMESPRVLAGAYRVAALARDASLPWEVVARRGRAGDPLAEYVLKTWVDVRGVDYFREAAHVEAIAGGECVDVFCLCYEDLGLQMLVPIIGDPSREPADSAARREARIQLGHILLSATRFYGLRIPIAWIEYVAAVLLNGEIKPEDRHLGWPGKALTLLCEHRDPRTPIVMWRLVRDNLYEEEDVVPALDCLPYRRFLFRLLRTWKPSASER